MGWMGSDIFCCWEVEKWRSREQVQREKERERESTAHIHKRTKVQKEYVQKGSDKRNRDTTSPNHTLRVVDIGKRLRHELKSST